MDGTALQEVARHRAGELPAVGTEMPFDPGAEVAKLLGKMLLLLTQVRGTPVVVLKAEPRDAETRPRMRRPVDPESFLTVEADTDPTTPAST